MGLWVALCSALAMVSPQAALAEPGDGAELATFAHEADGLIGESGGRASLEEAPSAGTVITGEEIRRFGWTTLDEVLANVRGLYVSTDRAYRYLGARGFGRPGDWNSRVLVTIDGHPLNEPVYLGMTLDELVVDVALVERIEIFRGPGSAIAGTNAVLGIVNIVTRQAPDPRQMEGSGLLVQGLLDSSRRRRLLMAYDQVFEGATRVSAWIAPTRRDGSSFDFPELGLQGPTARASDAEGALEARARVQHGAHSLAAGLQRRGKRIPTASYGVLPEAGEETFDLRAFAVAKTGLRLGEGAELRLRASLDWMRYFGRYPYAPEEGGTGTDEAKAFWIGAESTLVLRPAEPLTVSLGVSGHFAPQVTQRAFDGAKGLLFEDVRATGWFAAYAEGELRLATWAKLAGGLRYDRFQGVTERLSPRAALELAPLADTTVKLIYGGAFRAPNLFERFYVDGSSLLANPELKPEILTHYEVVLEQALGAWAQVILSAYWYELSQLINLVEIDGDLSRYENQLATRARGLEAELRGTLPFWGLRGSVAWAYADTRLRGDEERLSNSPPHLFYARLLAPVWRERLFLAGTLRFIDRRVGLPEKPEAPAAWLVDLTATFDDVLPGLDLTLGVQNLLDTPWQAPAWPAVRLGTVPQGRRAAWMAASWAF